MDIPDFKDLESLEDTEWLNDEIENEANKLAMNFSSINPSNNPDNSTNEIQTNSNMSLKSEESSQDQLSPIFGSKVSIKYNGESYDFVFGRQCPEGLPSQVFEELNTMKLGEMRTLNTVSSSSAQIGLESSSDSLELVSFNQIQHVIAGGSIYKEILFCPSETRNDKHFPLFESVVTVSWIGRLESTQETIDTKASINYRIGEGELGMGLEKALRTMHRGEKSKFTFLSPWTASICPSPLIPISDPKSTPMVYEITLESFTDAVTPWEIESLEDHLREAQLRKDQGNQAFSNGKYQLAITKYTKAQLFLETFKEKTALTEDEANTLNQLKMLLSLNLAAATLKTCEYEKVIVHAGAVLEVDPLNVKGLFRRASALMALKQLNNARKDLELLLNLEPNNLLAKQMFSKIQQKDKKDEIEQRQTYQRIFNKLEDSQSPPLYSPEEVAKFSENPEKKKSSPKSAFGMSKQMIILIAVAFGLLAVLLGFLLR